MSLEKDIHQVTKFRSEKQKAIVNLIYTYNWLVEQQRSFLETNAITMQQYNILRILRRSHQPIPLYSRATHAR